MARKVDLAAEAWDALGELMRDLRAGFTGVTDELALTPGEGRALAALDPDRPQPMRALADSLCCDASNVTWLVDRLEALGYVERRPFPADRRVKAVALTPTGVEAREVLLRAHEAAPAPLLRLSAEELSTLTRLLRKAVDHVDATDSEGNTHSRTGVPTHR